MNKVIAVIMLLAAMTPSLFSQGIGWGMVNGKIRSQFPNVRRMQTSELAQLLGNGTEPRPVLLDVRTTPEFEVSHIPGAIRVEPGSDPAQLRLPKDQRIITYCSVGYRSAAMAQKLGDAGYRNVANVEGSIFKWANENRPLVNGAGHPVDKVHPYNWLWGMLVDKKHRADNAPPIELSVKNQ